MKDLCLNFHKQTTKSKESILWSSVIHRFCVLQLYVYGPPPLPPPIWEDDFKGREATVDELWGWAKDRDKIDIAYIMAWWKNENIELDNSSPLKPVCLLILWLVLNFYNHFVFNY